MTKTVHPVLKKAGAVLLTVLVLVLMAVPAFAVALPDAPTGYVYDGANVLSSSTESYIERTGGALAEACGAEVVVATVDFTDGEDIADYAYDLFNKWGIGDKKANNGHLILLSIGAEDYYAEPGVGLTDVFTGGVLDAMLYDYLEDDFAAKEYDSGVKKVYARAVEILEDHYNVSYSTGTTNNANANTNYNYANNNTPGYERPLRGQFAHPIQARQHGTCSCKKRRAHRAKRKAVRGKITFRDRPGYGEAYRGCPQREHNHGGYYRRHLYHNQSGKLWSHLFLSHHQSAGARHTGRVCHGRHPCSTGW